jgi:uroporphyrinogen-III synthase
MPETYTSDAFIAGLSSRDVAGCRFLLPRADIAPKDLVDGIARLGAEVHEITAYRTVPAGEDRSPGKQMLSAGNIDIVTFTSSSTVSNLVKTLGDDWQSINRARVACIGPQTAAAAERAGLRLDIIASSHTIPGLVEAMEEYFLTDGREAV